jgi:hypothetical protein
MESISLKEEILNWHPIIVSGTIKDQDDWDKSYTYLELAYEILKEHKKDIGRIDVISNLKRAIDHRIKRISRSYNFKNMNNLGLPNEYIQRMAYFDLIKPSMIDVILKIRNLIEHHYDKPPDAKRCEELSDFVWYFLKATDYHSKFKTTSVILDCDYEPGYDPIYWLGIDCSYPYQWQNLSIYGWLHPEHIELDNSKGFQVKLNKFTPKLESLRSNYLEYDETWELLDEKSFYIDGHFTPNLYKLHAGKIIKAFLNATH